MLFPSSVHERPARGGGWGMVGHFPLPRVATTLAALGEITLRTATTLFSYTFDSALFVLK